MRVPLSISKLGQFAGMAHYQHAFKIIFESFIQDEAPFIADFDQLLGGKLKMHPRGTLADASPEQRRRGDFASRGHAQLSTSARPAELNA